jgi:hypothetical protein
MLHSEDLDAHLKGYSKAKPGFSVEGELDPYISFKGVDTDDPGGILAFYHYTFDPSLPRTIFAKEFTPSKPDLDKIKPYLGWAPTNIVGKTIENTTQYSRYVRQDDVLKMHFKSRFPAHNVKRRNEAVGSDTVFSDTKAVDNGATCAQMFVGRKSLWADCYPMKTDKEFARTLLEDIRRRGAMDKIITDRAKAEISYKVIEILQAYAIDDWQSEPYHQNQNFCEQRYQTIKKYVNRIIDYVGCPADLWLLCLQYVCYLLNRLATPSLNYQTPHFVLMGTLADISALLQYKFYEKVYFKTHNPSYPSDSRERAGFWVGVAEHVGTALTYKVLTADTRKIIYTSELRSGEDQSRVNKRADADKGEGHSKSKPLFIKDRRDKWAISHGELPTPNHLPTLNPDDLIGRTFIAPADSDREQPRVTIKCKIIDGDTEDPSYENVKFILQVDGDKADKIVGYNEVIEQMNRQLADEFDEESSGIKTWKFRKLIGHQGPLSPRDRKYKGCTWNVLVEWETGEVTSEPLNQMAMDDPITCAVYAKENDLLDTPGWKQFKSRAKREKRMLRELKQAHLRQVRRSVKFKFGYQVPRTYREALELDQKNGNTLWADAVKTELGQIDEYETLQILAIRTLQKYLNDISL